MNKKLGLLSVGCALFLAACSPLSESVWAPPAALPPGTPLELHLTPGTFTGSSNLTFNDELVVEVTVDESHILAIEVTQHNETPGFAAAVWDVMLPNIIAFNSTGVDIISGSTMTSLALNEAVELAMLQAGADLDTLRAFSPPLVRGYYTPGVFQGVGVGGFGGNIYVETTFSDQWIEDIRVTRHTDSAGLADSVMDHLITQILRYQHTDVDIITDATITANAFLAAVADTIEQATIDPIELQEPEPVAPAEDEVAGDDEAIIEEPIEDDAEEQADADDVELDVDANDNDNDGEVAAPAQEEAPAVQEATPPATEEPAAPAAEPEPEPAAPAGRFTPGTFTATAPGFYTEHMDTGNSVTVAITVDDNNITAINFSSIDTDVFVDMVQAMVGRAMAAQDGPVDIVSGATYTSNGFNRALQAAIAQASN